MTATLRGADIIARRLAEAGCRHAFGIPGGEVLTLIDALELAGIEFRLARHENAAGFMAEGTHHMTGAPGILVATVGPGAANALNVAANALQDRVPLIILTGRVDAAEAITYNHQVFDHSAVFAPVVKASLTVPDTNIEALIDKAITIAMDGRPGPVHIDLPIIEAGRMHAARPPVKRSPISPSVPAPGPDLESAREWLAGAERPLIIAGMDILHHDASDALQRFARTFSAPVLQTYKAKGVLAEDDPLAISAAALSPLADTVLHPLIQAADLIVLAGYDPIEMRIGWRNPWNPENQRVIEIAAAPNDHYMHHATISFVAHVGATLDVLSVDALSTNEAPNGNTWPDGEPGEAREKLAGVYGQNDAWGPAAIVETVRGALPRDGVVAVDTGAHRILLSQVWRSFEPRSIMQSMGLCTMGCAVPLAAGAKLAAPDRPVVAFTGDGGMEMILGELATLRDLGAPVVVVVFDDASLSLIEKKQREVGLANAGVDTQGTDFAAVAEAMGGRGVLCRDRESLATAVSEGLNSDGFTLCHCPIDRRSYDGRL
ncbi:MAG: thiamine pyrophosphate-binding protein [Rhodospirillaceae bacterium]|nr:thiamine pyrophosphate-binding protein [Rhodospirillaceae bacterium]